MQTKIFLSIAGTAALVLAAEAWQKPASDWSEKDCAKIVARSPWAKDTTANMVGGMGQGGAGGGGGGRGSRGGGGGGAMGAGGGMGEGGGGGGMSGGAGGGRGGGGGGMGGEMGGGMPAPPHVIVRWDSSAPIRGAMKKISVSKEVDEADVAAFYIVTMDGLKLGAERNRPPQQQFQPSAAPRGVDPRMQERLQENTTLSVKGKDAVKPAKMDAVSADGSTTMRFYFPRSMEISLDDKEVTFQTKVGPLEIKQKFVLKDMTFDGKLAL